jgi:hypothetical protein
MALMSITNTFEGRIFVDGEIEATNNVTKYALNLYPKFGFADVGRVAALYAGLGTPVYQSSLVHGDCASMICCIINGTF